MIIYGIFPPTCGCAHPVTHLCSLSGIHHPTAVPLAHPMSRSRGAWRVPAGSCHTVPASPAVLAVPGVPGARHLCGGRRRAWEVAGGQRRVARCCPATSTANCSSPPPRQRSWEVDASFGGTCTEPGWFGGAAECAHTPGLIDRALLAPVAERLSGAGSSSQLCRLLPLLFLGIQGISAAHRG